MSGSVESKLARVSPGESQPKLTPVGGYGGGFFLLFIENQEFKSDRDLGAWARDGLANKLEAAGYRLQRIENAASATSPLLVTIDVTGLSAKTTVPTGPPGVRVHVGPAPPLPPATCSVELSATIEIIKQGELVFSKSYRSTHQKVGNTCALNHGAYLGETVTEAFEDLLAQAVPQVTSSLKANI